MVTCTLRIGDRVALSSPEGAPEVEYALFDQGEIELAATGPGMVQEVGYHTTADEAIARLTDFGVTWALVLDTVAAMQPTLTMAYARGPAVRRVATALGAAELLDGFRYDVAAKQYDGRWIDLPALGQDLELSRFTHVAQAMHLLALLREVDPRGAVRLVTRELMATARKGGRSFRRVSLPDATDLPAKLEALAGEVRGSPHRAEADRTVGPTASEMLEVLRDRIVLAPEPDAVNRLHAIETAIGMRLRPLHGPLEDPELWALDEQLSMGRSDGVLELVDALEAAKGKQPATAYLRLRAAFIAGREDPRAIAERIGTLALTMPSFVELELLAAEAWSAAGDPKRALPFARDLVLDARVSEELRARESEQHAAMRPSQVAAEAKRASVMPAPIAMPEAFEEPVANTKPSARIEDAVGATDQSGRKTPAPETRSSTPGPPPSDGVKRTTQPLVSAAGPPLTRTPTVRSSTAPPPSPIKSGEPVRRETPPMMFGVPDPARPASAISQVPTTRNPGRRKISGTWVGPPPPGVLPPKQPTPSPFGVPGPDSGDRRTPTMPPPLETGRKTGRPSPDVPRLAIRSGPELMRGASQPPFRSDSPEAHAHVPKAAAIPRFDDDAEAAGALALPEGLSGVPDPIETLPRTVLDARVQFTFLARELGREYDEKLGIVLRADVTGIESMQRVLLERYKSRSVTSPEAEVDVRRHGAFLSEILARSFGAYWVDIGPSDVGYWAMLVPPGTRVWPFGRILRLIAMQHNERDLVSYFLELQARAASR